MKFRRYVETASIDPALMVDLLNSFNLHGWQDHPPGFVQLIRINCERENEKVFRYDFEFAIRPNGNEMTVIDPYNGTKVFEVHKSVDFNLYDFGEPVEEPADA